MHRIMLDGHNIHVIRVEQQYFTIAILLSWYVNIWCLSFPRVRKFPMAVCTVETNMKLQNMVYAHLCMFIGTSVTVKMSVLATEYIHVCAFMISVPVSCLLSQVGAGMLPSLQPYNALLCMLRQPKTCRAVGLLSWEQAQITL